MKKKKRSRTSKKGVGGVNNAASGGANKSDERERTLKFGSISLEEAAAAYEEAKGDADKATEILANYLADDSAADDQSTICSSSSRNLASSLCSSSGSSSSTASSAEVFVAFGSISLKEAAAAYKEAKGDAHKATEILANSLADDSAADDQSTICSSSSGNLASSLCSSSGSSSSTASLGEVFVAADFAQKGVRNQKGRPRKYVATAGTVSTMLGKDYVRSVPKRSSMRCKGFSEGSWSKEDVEQFLCSMLGDDCELSMGVVRDVLCQCGYDVDRALNVLHELSSSLSEQSQTGGNDAYYKEDAYSFLEASESLTDKTSDSASHSSESDFPDSVWYTGHLGRTRSKIGVTEAHPSRQGSLEPELPQKVLESLFNMPTPKNAEHEPNTMNWSNIVKKMVSLGQRLETCAEDGVAAKSSPAKGDEYQVFREAAKQHWESMKFCYQKAATAFSNGERDCAAYMSEQGRLHNKRAQEADERASRDIFKARNKTIENMITIDLHGQHVKQAMKFLKLHLIFGAYVQSVRSFRVITGCGSHGIGKSKLKESVISLLQNEGIKWCEENRGTLLIRLDEQTQFSFLDADSDNE